MNVSSFYGGNPRHRCPGAHKKILVGVGRNYKSTDLMQAFLHRFRLRPRVNHLQTSIDTPRGRPRNRSGTRLSPFFLPPRSSESLTPLKMTDAGHVDSRRNAMESGSKHLARTLDASSTCCTSWRTSSTAGIRAGKIKYLLTPGNQKRIPRAEVERITREMQEKPKRRTVKED